MEKLMTDIAISSGETVPPPSKTAKPPQAAEPSGGGGVPGAVSAPARNQSLGATGAAATAATGGGTAPGAPI